MASNDKEFLGITQNECCIQGKVVGDPVIQSENFAYLVIRTAVAELGENGQWFDNPMNIPVVVTDPRKVSVVEKYVQDGRELMINAYYKPSVVNGQQQHAFYVRKLTLGRKKFVPQNTTIPALQ